VGAVTRRARRTPILVIVTVLAVLVAGVALAYWRAGGSGSATATTSTTTALTLTPATPTAQLYPGGQASVVLSVTNSSPATVRFSSLVLDTGQGSNGFGVDGAHATCGLAALSFTTQTNGGAGWTVPGNGSLSITLTNALAMGTGAASSCQGASFTVYLAVAP
jgi:hypothetical protein